MKPTTAIAPVTDAAIIRAETEDAARKTAGLAKFEIATLAHRTAFASALAEVQAARKRCTEREKAATREPLAALDAARSVYRPAREAYETLEELIKQKLKDYEIRTAIATGEAVARAQEKAAAGDAAGAAAELATLTEALPNAPGMQVRHPWKYEVINTDLLAKQYLLPNYQVITAEMRKQLTERPGDAPVIAGVKFYRDLEIAGKGKQ